MAVSSVGLETWWIRSLVFTLVHQGGTPGFNLRISNIWDARLEERLQVVTG